MKRCLAVCLSILILLALPLSAAAADSKTIKVNKEISGKITSAKDSALYTFTLSKPGSVFLRFTNPNQNASRAQWKVAMYDKDNTILLKMDIGGSATDSTTWYYYAPKGTYTVKVTGNDAYAWSDATYKLTVHFARNTGQLEQEGKTNTLTAGKFMTGNMYTGSDSDLYKITLKKPGRISLNFNRTNLNDSSSYWQLRLYDKNNTDFFDIGIKGDTHAYKSGYYYLPKGTYYVSVYVPYPSLWFSFIDYKIRYTYTENKGQFEQEGKTSTLTSGKTVTGRNISYGDTDTYKIKVSKKGTVTLSFKHPNLNNSFPHWKVRLYNSKGTDLLVFDSKGTDTSRSGKVKLSAGTYYVQVATNGSYFWSSTEYKLKATVK